MITAVKYGAAKRILSEDLLDAGTYRGMIRGYSDALILVTAERKMVFLWDITHQIPIAGGPEKTAAVQEIFRSNTCDVVPVNITITIEGPDNWCFGVRFWIIAALLEISGHENWDVTMSYSEDHRTATVHAKRTICTSYRDGNIRRCSGVEATVTVPNHHDDIYSRLATQRWAREAVQRMVFTDWVSGE